ncbi:MAK10-like protein, partial [Tanacetum coccineum]
MPKIMKDPGLFTLPCRLGDSKPFDTLSDLGSCVNLIQLYLFKTLNVRILKETDNVLGLVDGIKSYIVGIVKDIEVYIGKLKCLEDFYVIDIEKDSMLPLLVGRGFFATASAVIDCEKAKIAAGEGVTISIFGVKENGLGHVDTPYWTTLAKRKSYESRPTRNTELNPFKDVLVFRKMVEFLGAIPINLKGNMWESKDLIDKKICWKRPPKEEDGALHIKIEIIDPDGENFDRTFQSIHTTRILSEKETPSDIIDLEH